jgi:hypothetical protein
LAVTNDQFALTATDREHGVNGHDAGLYRCIHTFTVNNTGSGSLNGAHFGCGNGAFAIDGISQWVNNATYKGIANRDGSDAPGSAHFVTRFDGLVIAHDNNTNGVSLQVQGKTGSAVAELNEFVGLYVFQTINNGHTVVYGRNRTNTAGFYLIVKILNLLEK